jgi:adenylate cyclase
VRIEAARLRRSLENYYLTAGQNDPIRIDMPKGAYLATFCYREVAHAPKSQPASTADKTVEAKRAEAQQHPGPELPTAISRRSPGRTRLILPIAAVLAAASIVLYMAYDRYEHRYTVAPDRSPSIRVDPIGASPHDAEHFALARGLTYEIVSQLTSEDQLRVYAPKLSAALPSDSQSAPPDYVLSGFVQSDGTVMVQLMDRRSQRIIWVSNFDADTSAAIGLDFQVQASQAIVDAILRHVTRQGETSLGQAGNESISS